MLELNLAQVISGAAIGGIFVLVATVIGAARGYGHDSRNPYYQSIFVIGVFFMIVWILAHTKHGEGNLRNTAEQNIRQVPSEAAPSAPPDEPSM